tara:strand:+ start:345 stop:1067 length:723 start_codon:yes stop_codon:yes gene_type:complete
MKYILIIAMLGLASCASTKQKEVQYIEPTGNIQQVYDPFEKVNRRIYKFNYYVDQYVLLPVTNGYEDYTPGPVQKGVSNFLDNLGEITTFINSSLQLKPRTAGITLSRFAINTTVGVLGIFDVASEIGLEEHEEDFGQTLAYYGVGEGPYLILPVLGPSNLRDLGGLGADTYAFNQIDPLNFDDHESHLYIYSLLRGVDTRKKVPIGYFGSGSPFEYDLLRRYYTDSRNLKAGSFKEDKF